MLPHHSVCSPIVSMVYHFINDPLICGWKKWQLTSHVSGSHWNHLGRLNGNISTGQNICHQIGQAVIYLVHSYVLSLYSQHQIISEKMYMINKIYLIITINSHFGGSVLLILYIVLSKMGCCIWKEHNTVHRHRGPLTSKLKF